MGVKWSGSLHLDPVCTPDAKGCLEESQCGRRRVHIFPFLTGCGLKLTWPAVRSNSEGKKTVIRLTMDSLIAANTKFCFDLFQKISTGDCRKNIFFCPLSLSAALGMVRLGARSGSARQIDQVLHFSEFSQNKGNKPDPCLKKAEQEGPGDSNLEGKKEVTGSLTLQTESSKDESGLLSCYFGQLLSKLARIKVDYTLSIANRLYGEREFPICPEYLDGVIQFYHTTVESVDFRKDTEKSRQEINFWVESQSQGKIKELFSKDSINNKTVLVLVNAVYFKAKWEKYFDCENTVDAVFSLSESEKKNVKMMNQNGLFRVGFVDELKAQILELPYTKGKLDMVVLLPSGSADNLKALEELERNITYEKLAAWSSSENMSEKRVAVSFPRFTLEDSYDLNPILQDMGITDIFDETKADLTGISPSPSLYLSKVVHKTFVEVDENAQASWFLALSPLSFQKPGPAGIIMDSLLPASARFGLDLFKDLSKTDEGNILFSPAGISTTIGMLPPVTRGAAATQEQEVPFFEKDTESSRIKAEETELEATEEMHRQLQRVLSEISKPSDDYELKIANRLFGEKTYLFLQKYLDYVEKHYHASLEPVDFVNAADESRKKINSWVESQTNEKIKDLLPDGSLSSSIKLVVVNVIYFKGQWDREFKKENTKEEEFWLNKSTSKSVLMMTQRQSFSFKTLEDVPAKILGLPYRNHDLSMFLLLPNDIDGLEKIIDKITPETLIEWTSVGRMEERAVDLHLPRFRVAGTYDLEATSAGLCAAGLSGSPEGAGLRAQRLLHRSVLELTEAGTEAAAATAVGFAVTPAQDWERFHCNHPFLFFIRHNKSDSVLFFGRFSSP
ncbi:hypothetical protein R6Z07_018707 [Ovis aries]